MSSLAYSSLSFEMVAVLYQQRGVQKCAKAMDLLVCVGIRKLFDFKSNCQQQSRNIKTP